MYRTLTKRSARIPARPPAPETNVVYVIEVDPARLDQQLSWMAREFRNGMAVYGPFRVRIIKPTTPATTI